MHPFICKREHDLEGIRLHNMLDMSVDGLNVTENFDAIQCKERFKCTY